MAKQRVAQLRKIEKEKVILDRKNQQEEDVHNKFIIIILKIFFLKETFYKT